MNDAEIRDLLQRVKAGIRVTKVVATRSVKGARGDHFVGFAAQYNSVQDEPAGQGKDLLPVLDSEASSGLALQEARIAQYLLSMQVDIAAHEAALASGSISQEHCTDACRAIRNNFGKLIRRALVADSSADVQAEVK